MFIFMVGLHPLCEYRKKHFEKLRTALLNVLKSCYNYTVSHLVTHTMAESENHKFSNTILHNHSVLSRSDWSFSVIPGYIFKLVLVLFYHWFACIKLTTNL